MCYGSPLVSVIIRAYNAEKYIANAIKSILNQSYSGFIEIIICYDDGTSDNTLNIIKNFKDSSYHGRDVLVYKHTHMTPFRALQNYGFVYSKGDYIMILDYDNVMPKYYISTIMKYAEESKASFLFSNAELIDQNGSPLKKKLIYITKERPYDIKKLITWNYIDGNTIAIRRDFMKKIRINLIKLSNKFFDNIFEDWLIALLALKESVPYYVKNAYIYYRIHSDNITAGEGTLYKTLNTFIRDITTLLAFYELKKGELSRKELKYLQKSLIKRHSKVLRYIAKNDGRLKLINQYSSLIFILAKSLDILTF